MPYYSTDSEEHRENVSALTATQRARPHDASLYDWWFEEPGCEYHASEGEDEDRAYAQLDQEVEQHNDEVMADSQYHDYITDCLNNDL